MVVIFIRQTLFTGAAVTAAALASLATLAHAAPAAAPTSNAASVATATAKPPPLAAVKKTVSDFFAAQPDYQAADIISQDQVKMVLGAIAQLGWTPADAEEILKKVPSEQEPLVKIFRTQDGKKLLRETASYDLVYDRLDRTAKLPGGVKLLESLPKLPDGAKYLQTHPTPGFKNLAQLLPKQASGKSPKGVDYNKPTGRIYTAKQLIAALEQSYLRQK